PSKYKARVDNLKDMEIRLADCVFAASDLAAESYLVHAELHGRVKTIPLGVDVDRFKPSVQQVSSALPFTFVFVGSATVQKGFDLILDALERLVSEGLSFRLLVAGVLDQSLVVGRKGLKDKIYEFGMIGQSRLPSILTSSDCLVLPSRFD